ncbi:hypothetical protein ACRCKN_03630 [Acinetobacter baumannii]|uniref:hypothetical protein n=1 Tax=Acinetobacter baumannii TaxID=470 RepID=UPI003D6A9FBC
MSVPVQTPSKEYIANGTTTAFPLEFNCDKAEYLIVTLNGEEAPVGSWTLANDTVTFNVAPLNGVVVNLERNTPFQRTTNYQLYDNSFRPSAVNKDFDLIWWKLQELGVADWILGNRIDALKNYVDDRDDELRAYLMEEIRKQGVALDQLEDYYNYLMQRLAEIAVDKGWDASFVVDGDKNQHQINEEQKQINNSLLMPVKTRLAPSINRVLYDHVIEQVNVKDYGAIGDGTLHTVQEWIDSGKFSSLADIQTEYPHVTALTDSVDWAAMQLCINMRKNIYAPSGTYHFGNKRPDTPHSGSPNRVDSSAYVFGDGCKTVFTRNAISEPATRILKPDGSLDIAATDDINNAEAVFAIHGSYYKFTDFMIQNSRVGFYFGQDLRDLAEKSACYKNTIRDVQIKRCGTGILFSAASGNHYNDISNIHFIENQIDCEMRTGKYDLAPTFANNNRNYFSNIRSNRSIVGLWCSSGDTNRFTAWDGEGCGAKPINNPYPMPVGLPKLADGVTQITNGVHIFTGVGQLNKVLNCQIEACDVELYNNQYRNSFVNNGYHEAVANGTQVYNLQEPGVFISHNTVFTPYFCQLSNINTNAFPNVSELGFLARSNAMRNNTGISKLKATSTSKNYSERRVFDLGAAASGSTKTVTIWRDVDPSSSANIKVKVSALSEASNLSFANELAVTAYRSSTKSLTRYFMQETLKLRATGQNVGDSTNVIVPTIANGGASTRELVLTLTMPAYAIDSVFVEVELIVSSA